jgi:hypothetical protein
MKKIILSLALLCAAQVVSLAQDADFLQIKSNITLGFQSGIQVNKCQNQTVNKYQYTNRMLVRKKLTHHLDIESGINYTVVPMGFSAINQNIVSEYRNIPNQLSIPVTLQYNFLSENSRFRPYISAGGIYDIIKTNYPARTISYTDGNVPNTQNGNRYIGLIVTQGVIYEVNTKIQFNENIHFIQENKCKTIGFDLGIGYKL